MKPKNPCLKETCRHHNSRGFGRCPYCEAKDRQLKKKEDKLKNLNQGDSQRNDSP